jgi:hypothetical protein
LPVARPILRKPDSPSGRLVLPLEAEAQAE